MELNGDVHRRVDIFYVVTIAYHYGVCMHVVEKRGCAGDISAAYGKTSIY